jgi:hypothetical protein
LILDLKELHTKVAGTALDKKKCFVQSIRLQSKRGLVSNLATGPHCRRARSHQNTRESEIINRHKQPGGHQILVISVRYKVRLGASMLRLRKMHVHFVAIKVGVVGVAIGVVQTQGLLSGQHANSVSHDGGFVEGWLPVNQDDVPVLDVAQNFFVGPVTEISVFYTKPLRLNGFLG